MRNSNRLQSSQGDRYVDVRREDGQPVIGNTAMRRPVFLGNGLVAKSVRMNVPRAGHPAMFDPSVSGPAVCVIPPHLLESSQAPKIEVRDDEPVQQYTQREIYKTDDIFADMGLIQDDSDDEANEDPGEQDPLPTIAESNRPTIAEPEDVFAELASKDIRDFGITKEDMQAMRLTKRHVRLAYEGVTGKNPGDIDIGLLKKRIRDFAGQGYANYKRTITELERVRREFPAKG